MNISKRLQEKLKKLPALPGVYFHKNKSGEIIYIGKAAKLNNRVRQYFQPAVSLRSELQDPKTTALINEIEDVDWMVVDSELEALFLEAEQIRRNMPKYNILLRDDKSMIYIRIDYNSEYPTVTTTRRPLDDGARYFGPYLSAFAVRQALRALRKVFPYATRRVIGQKRASLHYHLGLDPGLEEGKTSLVDYRKNLRRLISVIQGKREKIEKQLESDMKSFAKNSKFEQAAIARNQLYALKRLGQQIIFSDKEFLDISKDHALAELVEIMGLKKFPRRIEGFDISHQQGSSVVASMVVFINGVSAKDEYRKFKTKLEKNDDFYNMNETITRRLSGKNTKAWGVPDIMLIDGGKGQLSAALKARDKAGYQQIAFIGLAKRDEEIIVSSHDNIISVDNSRINKLGGYVTESDGFSVISLPKNTNLLKLFQRIRDESHRFAVSYHSIIKSKRQTASLLDDIPGVGQATRRKLIRAFGSLRAVREASESDISKLIGPAKAKVIKNGLSIL